MPEPSTSRGPALVAAGLGAIAVGLALVNLREALPPSSWSGAVFAPNRDDIGELVVHFSLLPRIAAALLCGLGLGLAGALLQQVLRNPLAEPGTLGVFAGARLSLAAATLWAPDLLGFGYEPVAFAGATACMGFVLLLSRGRALVPIAVVFAGMVVSLALEAANKMLAISHREGLSDLLSWERGSLAQNSWATVETLLPQVAIAAVAAALAGRSLALLELSDDSARSLGGRLGATRLTAFAIAIFVSASVIAAVGTIGFIGLAGPAIARAAGARRPGERLVWGAALSAVILLLADQAVLVLGIGDVIETGQVTGVLGAPLLVWLVWRLRAVRDGDRLEPRPRGLTVERETRRVLLLLPMAAGAVWLALSLGRVPDGWQWSLGPDLSALMPWRGPRVFGAMAAGFLLSVAGALMQRVSGNAMASPELLGVSAGAAIVVVAAVLFVPELGTTETFVLAALGAAAALALVLWFGRRSAFAPLQMLLIGVGLEALLTSIVDILQGADDPRTGQVLAWLAGSTYGVTWSRAALACALAGAAALILPLVSRALAILPLGASPAQAVGLAVGRSRLVLLALAAFCTSTATLLVGPLSFVGLMAPHLARHWGTRRPMPQTIAAGLIGASIMVMADWLGRMLAFPWQIPTGIMATAVGGLYCVWAMRTDR